MISVCICTYNGENYVYKQLESIRQQSLKADEVIICDDCSRDGTVAVIEQFIDTFQLGDTWHLYRNESNKGYPGNIYYAMSLCKGDIVFLADQDDLWKTDKLERMTDVMNAHSEIVLLSSKWGIIDGEDRILKEISRGKVAEDASCEKITIPDVLYCYDYPGMAMCYRKELGEQVLQRVGKTRLFHDVALCLIAAERNSFYCVNQINQYHRRHDANVAMEEHRVRKLLNKERKILEIEKYIDWLKMVLESNCLEEAPNIALIGQKREIMQERLDNLVNAKRMGMLRQYFRNRKKIRLATLICDLLICSMR